MGMNWKFWTWGKKEEPVTEVEEVDANLDVGGWSADSVGAISRRKREERR